MNKFLWVLLFVIVFMGGVAARHFGWQEKTTVTADPALAQCQIDLKQAKDEKNSVAETIKLHNQSMILKLSLLKDYINFILLPSKDIADPKAYAAKMDQKAQAMNDKNLLDEYYATGDQQNKEKNILTFFNDLIDNVSTGLQ